MYPVLPLRCRLDDFTGYGQFSVALADALFQLRQELGFSLRVHPILTDFRHSPMPEQLAPCISRCRNHPEPWELLLYPMTLGDEAPAPGKRTVAWTMWESTQLPAYALRRMNRCSLVLVPSGWGAAILSACGLQPNVRVAQLGIPSHWHQEGLPQDPGATGTVVFGTAGRFAGGGQRKGFDTVLQAFANAFPEDTAQHVRLEIKAFGDCPVRQPRDPRVRLIQDHWSRQQLVDWYHILHAYVSASSGEGWGLHQQEAMANARPLIAPLWSGLCEFLNPANGVLVDYRLAPGTGVYHNLGHMGEPTTQGLTHALRHAEHEIRHNFQAWQRKCLQARDAARYWSIDTCARHLVELLRTEGFLTQAPAHHPSTTPLAS